MLYEVITFGMQSWVELIKSILKVSLVAGVAFTLINRSKNDLFQLSLDIFPQNIYHSLDILLNFILLISCSLLVVVAIDIPFQIWQHANQLKMTKQEVKDEYKDTEGKPEVKGRIRMLQREARITSYNVCYTKLLRYLKKVNRHQWLRRLFHGQSLMLKAHL